jgi:DNA-binding HxlR family transcriptional regulator
MRNAEKKEDAIMWCLQRASNGLTFRKLQDITGIWTASLSFQLYWMERHGVVTHRFVPGPHPRHVRYYMQKLAPPIEAQA